MPVQNNSSVFNWMFTLITLVALLSCMILYVSRIGILHARVCLILTQFFVFASSSDWFVLLFTFVACGFMVRGTPSVDYNLWKLGNH